MSRALFRCGLSALTLTLGAAAAPGQLGETPAEIARRFGPPVRHNARVRAHQIIGGPGTAGDVHLKDGCFVRVVYGRGVSVQAEYSLRAGALAEPQVEALLAEAAAGSKWKATPSNDPRNRFYRRLDGHALASWTLGPEGSLLIAADPSSGPWNDLLLDPR